MTPELKNAVNNITDVFTGADGGGNFVDFYHSFLPEFERRALNGDKASEEIIRVVTRFSKLLEVCRSTRN